jgi:hypothetical protein
MGNARKLANLIVGNNVKVLVVDSDLTNTVNTLKSRLDSDDAKLQSIDTSVNTSINLLKGRMDSDDGRLQSLDSAIQAGIQNLADSDLIITQLQAKINATVSNVDSDSGVLQGINTKIAALKTRLDSDDAKLQSLDTTIQIIKGRLDSDETALQAAATLAASAISGAGLKDSDLKVVADLRNQLDSEILFVKNLSASYIDYIYNATANQTTFTGTDANSATLYYTVGNIQVFLNGVKLLASDFTATDGVSVVLAQAVGLDTQLVISCTKLESNYIAPSVFANWSSTPTNTAAFQPSNVENNDAFGISVGIDRNYAIIGAQGQNAGGHDASGAGYVYYKSGGTWSQQAQLDGPNAYAAMGAAVAIGGSSEGERLALGGYAYNTSSGIVNWYERSGTNWTKVGGDVTGNSLSNFGFTLRMSGDTTLVSAPVDDTGGADRGRVYVYTGSGNAQANFTASDIANGDNFGTGIDIDGDLIVVGSPKRAGPLGQDRYGAAYIFERSGTTWTQKAKLTHSDQGNDDRFGISVACYEGSDGTNTIAVGAKKGSNNSEGAVYIFTGSGTSYTQQQKLTASDAANGDNFGAINGNDVSIDKGTGNAVFVGAARRDDSSLSQSGAVYVFNRSGSTWSQSYKLNPFTIGPSVDGLFGYAVSVDSHGSLIVGASNDDQGGASRGAAYIFDAQ